MTARFGAIPSPTDRYVAGIGFASAASSAEIIALINGCLSAIDLQPRDLHAIGTHMRKRTSPLLLPVALHFGVPLRLLDDDDLTSGAPGVAEAVAAMAGTVQLHKQKTAYATCAIARCSIGFDLSGFGHPAAPSAAMAASTLLTSSAGP